MNKMTLAVLLGLMAGCASVTPRYDTKFGDAVRAARVAQTVNPTAPAHKNPAPGLDGKAAVHALERYQDSFKAPPKTVDVHTIGGAQSGQ